MYLESFLLLSFISLLLYFIYERFQLFQLFSKLGIPGPRPNMVVGNMMDLSGRGKIVTEVMANWEREYGPFYGYFRGTRPVLVVRDKEVIKEILVKKSANFINRPKMIMSIPPIAHTVVGLRDQRWREVRHTLSPTFSSAKIKQMLPIMMNCLKTTVEILEEEDGGRGERVVDAHRLFQGLACDVISACALAMKVNSQRDPNDRFYTAVKGFLENAMGPFVKAALCFPLLAKAMEWGLETFGYSHEMTTMIIDSVRTAMEVRRGIRKGKRGSGGEGGSGVGRNKNNNEVVDALQLMMDSKLPDQATPALSDEEIVGNSWVFILGGFETTSASLSYTCYLLSLHQEVQEKLFGEITKEFGLHDVPTYDKINELTYLDQVICESLRLFPPVVNFVVRGLDCDSWIGPYFVPKHVGIQIPVWQVHHDPDIWPEPYHFSPERFNHNAKKVFANNMDWIPFGGGPRNCIGSRFAMLNMKFTLVSILRKFKVVPASDFIPHKLKLKVPSVTIVPDGGIPLRFLPRDE